MVATDPLNPPAPLDVALRKLADSVPLTREERILVEERLEALSPTPATPEEAPIDDEPETPEESAAVAEALASVQRGELIPAAEVYRRLGL